MLFANGLRQHRAVGGLDIESDSLLKFPGLNLDGVSALTSHVPSSYLSAWSRIVCARDVTLRECTAAVDAKGQMQCE